MVLETTMICLDNSEYSRNGDYIPSRLEAQRDVANLICGAKSKENAENAVGLLTAAGNRPTVRVNPTQDVGKILQGLHSIEPEGELDIVSALQTAQLALKHRLHKNQKQRIVLFVGSPVIHSIKQLEALGKMLKKNNISLDIISFGDTAPNSAVLSKLYQVTNSNDTSHFLEYPVEAGCVLSNMIMTSPIIRAENDVATDLVNASGDIVADPNLDPEFYMALQISLQEEQARQAAARAADSANEGTEAITQTAPAQSGDAAASEISSNQPNIEGVEDMDESLREAISMSLSNLQGTQTHQSLENVLSSEQTDTMLPTLTNLSHELVQGGDISIIPSEDISTTLPDRQIENTLAAENSLSTPNVSVFLSEASSGIANIIGEITSIDTSNPELQEALQQVLSMESLKHNSSEELREKASEDQQKDHENMEDDTQDQRSNNNHKQK